MDLGRGADLDGWRLPLERAPLRPPALLLDRPFFLLMTLPVLALGYGFVSLGAEGWKWLGLAIGGGATAITALAERGGKYS